MFSMLLALAAPPAVAAPPLHDNRFGIYDVNPVLSTGRAEGFRELWVDPATLLSRLQPAERPQADGRLVNAPPLGDLPLDNDGFSWVEVRVSGHRIGQLGPLTTGWLHGVAYGAYDVTLVYPDGLERTRRVRAIPASSPGAG